MVQIWQSYAILFYNREHLRNYYVHICSIKHNFIYKIATNEGTPDDRSD